MVFQHHRRFVLQIPVRGLFSNYLSLVPIKNPIKLWVEYSMMGNTIWFNAYKNLIIKEQHIGMYYFHSLINVAQDLQAIMMSLPLPTIDIVLTMKPHGRIFDKVYSERIYPYNIFLLKFGTSEKHFFQLSWFLSQHT